MLENSALVCGGTQFTEEGEYTLAFNVTDLPPFICIDYITHILPASVQAEPATMLIDKSVPAISYVGNWTTTDASYGSAIFTQAVGSHLLFNFTGASTRSVPLDSIIHSVVRGASVTWIGFIPTQPVGANYTYSVDGGKSMPLSLHPSPLNSLSSQVFFTSPNLSYGLHSLVVEKTGGDTGAPLIPNSFTVVNGSALTPSSVPPPVVSSVPTPSTGANRPNSSASVPIRPSLEA